MRMAIRAAIPMRIPTSRPDKMPRLASRSRTLPRGLPGAACCDMLGLLSYDHIDDNDNTFLPWLEELILNSSYSEDGARLHVSATMCKALTGLPRCRNSAQLLQQTQVVTVAPEFDALPVGEAGDGDPRCRHLFARRCNAHEVACVSATKGMASHDFVSFRDQILNGEKGIGEGGEIQREELFEGFETLHCC